MKEIECGRDNKGEKSEKERKRREREKRKWSVKRSDKHKQKEIKLK